MGRVFLLAAALTLAAQQDPLQRVLNEAAGVVELPPGLVEVREELTIPEGVRELEIRGAPQGTTLRASEDFRGRAILTCRHATAIRFRDFTIDGNRQALQRPLDLPPYDAVLAEHYLNNGLLLDSVRSVTVSGVRFREMAGFAVLVVRSQDVVLERLEVEDSGSRKADGTNNATGGVLFSEGTLGFEVRDSLFRNIHGNAVWTHSVYASPRNRHGRIHHNRFEEIGRDAIQIGHASSVRVERNTGKRIGYPVEAVDVEGGGTPVALDTAGDVDHSIYAENSFEEVNGKCIDLDGFHDGEVHANTCINRGAAEEYPFGHYGIVMNNANPDMEPVNVTIAGNVIDGTKFGGIFVIGSGHRVTGNRLTNLNKAGCHESGTRFGCLSFPAEPDLLRTGIYLGSGGERPAVTRDNVVKGNEISGHGMSKNCIGFAPGVRPAENRVGDNQCRDH
jgi:hypothetical protein